MKMRRWLVVVGLWLGLNMVSALRLPQKPEIRLTKSGPVIATHDGQVIQNKFIQVTEQDGMRLSDTRLINLCESSGVSTRSA